MYFICFHILFHLSQRLYRWILTSLHHYNIQSVAYGFSTVHDLSDANTIKFFITYIWRWFIWMTIITTSFWFSGNFANMEEIRRKCYQCKITKYSKSLNYWNMIIYLFNHILLTFFLMCGLKLPFNIWDLTHEILNRK